mgnify:CR=1 FL=1
MILGDDSSEGNYALLTSPVRSLTSTSHQESNLERLCENTEKVKKMEANQDVSNYTSEKSSLRLEQAPQIKKSTELEKEEQASDDQSSPERPSDTQEQMEIEEESLYSIGKPLMDRYILYSTKILLKLKFLDFPYFIITIE